MACDLNLVYNHSPGPQPGCFADLAAQVNPCPSPEARSFQSWRKNHACTGDGLRSEFGLQPLPRAPARMFRGLGGTSEPVPFPGGALFPVLEEESRVYR